MTHWMSCTATEDPRLTARMVNRVPLHYAEGADASLDRPAHVRAGSGLAWVAGRIALIQDDSNFVAVVDPRDGRVGAVALPAGEAGRRQFDDLRGNKAFKLDLEACVALEDGGETVLLALGSGSSPRREYVAVVDGWAAGQPSARLVHVPRLYGALRATEAFSGSELNLEGAIHLGGRVRLFARGNGAQRGNVRPANATCDVDGAALLAHVRAPERTAPPLPADIVQYALGTLDGVPLGFTDAAVFGGDVLFAAAAEDSPDATRDGRVTGSVIGVIDAAGRARWVALTEPSGAPARDKVEGVLVAGEPRDGRLFAVVDADDPGAASQLCTVALSGPWRG